MSVRRLRASSLGQGRPVSGLMSSGYSFGPTIVAVGLGVAVGVVVGVFVG